MIFFSNYLIFVEINFTVNLINLKINFVEIRSHKSEIVEKELKNLSPRNIVFFLTVLTLTPQTFANHGTTKEGTFSLTNSTTHRTLDKRLLQKNQLHTQLVVELAQSTSGIQSSHPTTTPQTCV